MRYCRFIILDNVNHREKCESFGKYINSADSDCITDLPFKYIQKLNRSFENEKLNSY